LAFSVIGGGIYHPLNPCLMTLLATNLTSSLASSLSFDFAISALTVAPHPDIDADALASRDLAYS